MDAILALVIIAGVVGFIWWRKSNKTSNPYNGPVNDENPDDAENRDEPK